LGIPTIKDRVVQQAALLILEPIFEADFRDSSFGFRPGRSAHDALRALVSELRQGRTEVFDADLASYFDSIPHDKLMRCVEMRVADGSVLRLIRAWLETPIEDRDDDGGKPRRHRPSAGTPQGGVISPLLANVYLHWLDVLFARTDGPGTWANAKLIRYADDFVIVARHVGERITKWTKYWLEARMGLKLNVEKTAIRHIKPGKDRLVFLGYETWWKRPRLRRKGNWHYLHLGPARKSIERAKAKIYAISAKRQSSSPIPAVVAQLNRFLRGWAQYFKLGYPSEAFHSLDRYVTLRLRHHLQRRSQRPSRWPRDRGVWQHAHDDLGLLLLPALLKPSTARR
jgi:RNA-directed DNA polymerase